MRPLSLRSLIAAVAIAVAPAAFAAEAKHPPHQHWHFDGWNGSFDRGALQRGFQVYREVCSTCHSLKHMSFRNLGEKGGPFYGEMVRDHATGEKAFKVGEHHGDKVIASDNPYVKAFAAEYTVVDGVDDVGDPKERKGIAADRFPSPYANSNAARAANGGALPPDLSVIIKARHGGADYVHALLTGYGQKPPANVKVGSTQYYNPYFPGGAIGMPAPLTDGLVTYEDGTPATTKQMASDVVQFLAWAADPHMEARKSLGFSVLIYLSILSALVYAAYRQIWKDVKH